MPNIVYQGATQRPVPRPDQALNARIADAERDGIAAIAHLQTGAFATSVAMQNACMLSQAATAACRLSPAGAEAYRRILMAYGTLAASEIQDLGFQGRRF